MTRRCPVEGVAAMHHAAFCPTAPRRGRIDDATSAGHRRACPDPLEQRIRFIQRQTFEPGVAAPPRYRCRRPFRMHAHERMQRAGRRPRSSLGVTPARTYPPLFSAVMFDAEVLRRRAQRLGERLPRAVHRAELVSPPLVALRARRGCSPSADRAGTTYRCATPLAGAEAADRDTVLDHVRDHIDLRIPVDEASAVLLNRRLIERSEARLKASGPHRTALIAYEQHLVVQPGSMDGRKGDGVHSAQIGASDLCAERSAGGNHVEGGSHSHVGVREDSRFTPTGGSFRRTNVEDPTKDEVCGPGLVR